MSILEHRYHHPDTDLDQYQFITVSATKNYQGNEMLQNHHNLCTVWDPCRARNRFVGRPHIQRQEEKVEMVECVFKGQQFFPCHHIKCCPGQKKKRLVDKKWSNDVSEGYPYWKILHKNSNIALHQHQHCVRIVQPPMYPDNWCYIVFLPYHLVLYSTSTLYGSNSLWNKLAKYVSTAIYTEVIENSLNGFVYL